MHLKLRVDGEDRTRTHEVWLTRTEDTVALEVDGEQYEAIVAQGEDGELIVEIDGAQTRFRLLGDEEALIDGQAVPFSIPGFDPRGAPGEHDTLVEAEGTVFPPMPGTILDVHVEEGDKVEKGDPLAVLEAMKMQSTIEAPRAGTVLRAHAVQGATVEGDEVLFEIGEEELLDEG